MVGDLHIPLTPKSISEALEFPLSGELYHKGFHFKDKGWKLFLDKSKKGSFDRSKGIPNEWFNEPWAELVLIIQKFFTCDSRHSVVQLYHIRLLQHSKGDIRINLPYFFYRNLMRMIESVKSEIKPKKAQIHH